MRPILVLAVALVATAALPAVPAPPPVTEEARVQAVATPGPAAQSTMDIWCGRGCPIVLAKSPDTRMELVVTNDHDHHVYRCVWPPGQPPACTGHAHEGGLVHSTLSVSGAPGTAAVYWWAY
ncbi:MAG TPA: hypothetical protein VM681_09670 [Candidatus Thermoplasmatota archaeon]|nr:hypothetical protein [Candidatus Thermoplasmatota archaeon]